MAMFALFGAWFRGVGGSRWTNRASSIESPLFKLRNGLLIYVKSLCNNCGLFYEREKRLPPWAKNLHHLDPPIGAR